jgi:nitrogen fixation/metabolism regulation signal transduction histidine kinase
MSDSVKRVSRLISQMRYLAREAVVTRESVSLSQLVKEAFKEAHTYQPAKSAKLQYDNGKHPIVLVGDPAALTHALAEVILNAIQANPADAKVAVHAQTKNDPEGHEWVQIEITDNGVGFTSEAAERVPAPFFTTRTVGLGLGLCVSRKIIEVHHGQLVIPNPDSTDHGAVRISLPVEAPPSSTI